MDVNKIRQELESICGANKVNKSAASDDGDFVALDSILKGAAIESKALHIVMKNFKSFSFNFSISRARG